VVYFYLRNSSVGHHSGGQLHVFGGFMNRVETFIRLALVMVLIAVYFYGRKITKAIAYIALVGVVALAWAIVGVVMIITTAVMIYMEIPL